jgi:hypothetical protein
LSCVYIVCCLIVVPLPPGENPFAVNNNNNNNNNNNILAYITMEMYYYGEVSLNARQLGYFKGILWTSRDICIP